MEAGFCYHTDYESLWFSSDEKGPELEWRMIASPKLILIVVWNPAGFHVVDVVEVPQSV
jgi:hypothetical protein